MFAELLWVEPEQVVAGGNSSLTMMRDMPRLPDALRRASTRERPWSKEDKVRFVCPVPGYDRHFTLLESLGIEMVTVPMNDDGPDVDAVAAPRRRRPERSRACGSSRRTPTRRAPICSQDVAARLAAMPTAAPDFKIFWDNAYALHHLTEEEAKSADILTLASAAGHPDRPDHVRVDLEDHLRRCGCRVPRGVDEQRPLVPRAPRQRLDRARQGQPPAPRRSSSAPPQGVRDHMAKHREIIAPKFAEVDRVLTERLGGRGVATWNTPTGGYFVNLDVVPGTASRVVALAKEAGIALTPAGSSFPYKQDPDDTNIRLAPTMPPLAEVTAAMEAVATCVLLAAAEKAAGESAA